MRAGLILSLYSTFHGSLCFWPGDYRVCRPTSLKPMEGVYINIHRSTGVELMSLKDDLT